MQKILVTGSNGFLGQRLVPLLSDANYEVLATGKGDSRFETLPNAVRYQSLDFTDRESVIKLVNEYQPQFIIHAGALSKPDECEQNKEAAFLTNVSGTLYLLEAAEAHKSHFIFLSTDFVFSGKGEGMYREEDTREPVNYYGQTKMLAEDEVMKYPHAWTIVRTVLVYGKALKSRENLVTNTANALKEGRPLKIFNDQVRTPTYIDDLANGIVKIVQKSKTGIFHLSGKDVLTPYQMAVTTAEFLQLSEKLISPVKEEDLDQPARRPLRTGFDITKAASELGYEPVSFMEGVRRTFSDH